MSRKKGNIVKLPSSLTISAVEALHQQLQPPAFEKGLQLDASEVEVVDTAGLQLLLAAQQRLEVNGGTIEWVAGKDILSQALKTVGLDEFLVI